MSDKWRKVVAIDFDGTLCESKWPEIGAPNWDIIQRAKAEQEAGAALILWTCREGQQREEAVAACHSWGLHFDAVNENLPERTAEYGNDCRKIGADEYWDDKAVTLRQGRWKLDINPYSHRWNYKCTACGGWTTDETDYCPNCGARMDKEEGK